MPRTFFTSDTHFGHRNIIKYCNRPFIDDLYLEGDSRRYAVEAMNEFLIERWNSVVGKDDIVYHLGDFAYTGALGRAIELRLALNGKIHFIEGNHDAHALAMHEYRHRMGWSAYAVPFQSWHRINEVEVEGQRIVLCHYAMREWHHALRGTWHLFGHTHATLAPFGKSCDVGADNAGNIAPGFEFCPLSFEQIKAFMDQQPIGPHPGFENYWPGHPELERKSYSEV